MKPTIKEIFQFLQKDNTKELENITLKFDDLEFSNNENLLKIIMRNVFFYEKNKFSFKALVTQKKKYNWLNVLLNTFFIICSEEKDYDLYDDSNGLFSFYYNTIEKNYSEFMKVLLSIKSKIYDLFVCLISFFSYLNGNNKFLNFISDDKSNNIIKELRSKYNTKKKKSLLHIIINYCNFVKIPVLFHYENDKFDPKIYMIELDELKCVSEVCSKSKKFHRFVQTLYECIHNFQNLGKGRQKKVKEFIRDIFILLNIFLGTNDSLEDSILDDIYEEIYKAAYNYTSNDFNQNYIDFVISYVTKYHLTKSDFFHLFMGGLVQKNFKNTFTNLKLDTVKDINNEKDIKELINMIYERKKKKKNISENLLYIDNHNNNSMESQNKQLSESLLKNEDKEQPKKISKEPDDNKNCIKYEENKDNYTKENNDDKTNKWDENMKEKQKENESKNIYDKIYKALAQDFNNKFNQLENKISVLEKENKKNSEQISVMEKENKKKSKQISVLEKENKKKSDQISELKEEIGDLNEDNNFLNEENRRNKIEILKTSGELDSLNKRIDIISFRDLSKRILDNMITFVSENNKNIFIGLNKRKEKLKKLNEKYNFKGIEYMKIPIEEMTKNYYDSNIISHVPKIVDIFRRQPFGLNGDPAEDIAKRFFNITIKSKDNNVLIFMKEHLFLKKEIEKLYLNYPY